MEQAFYKNRLSDKFGIDVVIPDEAEREIVHQVIYTELCLGQINNASCNQYLKIISSLHNQGVEVVILGCTEIVLLVQQTQTAIPLYDTTEIDARKAVKLAIGE